MTPPPPLLLPLFAMVALTFIVTLTALAVRLRYIRRGDLSLRYFAVMRHDRPGAELPDAVVKTSRNLLNLFEMPVLFYVAVLTALNAAPDDESIVTLAWAFVAMRVLHSLVHCTYNDVRHRFTAYAIGLLALAGLWARLAVVALAG